MYSLLLYNLYYTAVVSGKASFVFMKKRHGLHHIWLIFATYGVYFAIFSGLQEVAKGIWWKFVLSLILGTATYFYIEWKMRE